MYLQLFLPYGMGNKIIEKPLSSLKGLEHQQMAKSSKDKFSHVVLIIIKKLQCSVIHFSKCVKRTKHFHFAKVGDFHQ